ncbi:PadR family transcriptional regulator [Arthrobacter flavus]|uniref:PadR family transcriptional regulator n=1 Tax=Arthrobacter flavus TaxID=95172 RepID=A0ABW4Q6Y5_9MICC
MAREQIHGYELLIRLKENGFGHIKGGVLYPILHRLEDDGLVAHTWDTGTGGPARKVLRLTPEGEKELAHAKQAWQEITQSLNRLNAKER